MSSTYGNDLLGLLSTTLFDSTAETDEQVLKGYVAATAPDRVQRVATQLQSYLDAGDIDVTDLGTQSNRWFGEADEAREWLASVLTHLRTGSDASDAGDAEVVKDSNGAPLVEGDSVVVIKDLKVKGGSSDLKRGTLIKKIHLIGDPDNIECRVDGSTLVLKTCFLKKG